MMDRSRISSMTEAAAGAASRDDSPRRFGLMPGAAVLLGALAVYLVLRLPGLRGLSVFADEAIYTRYGQLIARDPLGNAFVSLVDPKPPLHFWILAAVMGLAADPLLPARVVAVLVGAANRLWPRSGSEAGRPGDLWFGRTAGSTSAAGRPAMPPNAPSRSSARWRRKVPSS